MRHSTEPRDWIFVKGYSFLSFAKNLVENKKKCDKYNQKNLDRDKQTAPGVLKTATTKAIQKTTGSTAGNLIGNKIEDAVV